MELVYLWVEDYKNIHKQGFNFSPRFRCAYDEDNNELTIDENEDYIEGFFGDNINVTAIVGKNGSGKSSLLEILTQKSDLPNMKKTFKIQFDKYSSKFYIESNFNLVEANINNITIHLEKKSIKNIIYYADNFSSHSFTNTYIDNISLANLINKIDIEKFESTLNLVTLIIKTYEIILIKKFDFIPGISKLPKNIVFSYIEDAIDTSSLINFAKSLLNIINEKSSDLDYATEIYTLKDLEESILKLRDKKLIDDYDNIKSFLYEYQKILKYASKIDHKLTIPIEKINRNFIETLDSLILIDTNLSEDGYGNFIDLNWEHELSTGEDTFLRFYSLLFQVIKHKKYFIEDFILVIDEVENNLHPSWQAKVINLIIDFLTMDKLGLKGNIQIVITTHSPFLLSDIPKQNIIFLDKDDKNGNCKVVDGLKEKKQTFGANIHTLLSDGFFMGNDGLMGEFAKNKINEIIKNLNNKDYTPLKKEKTNILKIIKSIGEPFLRKKLLDMYYKKFNDIYTIKARKI